MAETDGAALTDIRDRYAYAEGEWQPIRAEGAIDMKYVSGDPWTDQDKRERKDAGRPCMSFDEIGQYVNQLINEIRASKRAIEVNPVGDGAKDAVARIKGQLIRQIEYRSKSQHAYTTMFENTVQRSYGYLRVTARYMDQWAKQPSASSFDQELVVSAVQNPDLVTPDPDANEPDLSDMQYCFVREKWTHEESRQRWKTKSPSAAALREAGVTWMDATHVHIGEYWAVETRPKTLVLMKRGEDLQAFWKDTIPKDVQGWEAVRERTVEHPYVCQKIVNGLDILDKVDWPGRYIPIVACLGKVLWFDNGGKQERRILSMVRLMRDPFMAYCFTRTCEIEAMGGIPRSTWVGYTGQFDSRRDDWVKANHRPVAFLEADPVVKGSGSQILPLPQKQAWDPPIQNLEIAAESYRRAIQSASGSGFLPTQAQRRNEKSGVALKQIESSAQKGSYHFIDHYENAIQQTGIILEDLMPHYYDTVRDIYVRDAQDRAIQVRINDPSTPEDESKEPILMTEGRYDVTLSTGPRYEDERDKASEFADLLAQNPAVFPLIGDLVVRLKNLGPTGDELAKRLETLLPPELKPKKDGEQVPPEVLQRQVAEARQMLEMASQEIQRLQQEIQTDAVKAERDVELTRIKSQLALILKRLEGEQQRTLQDDQQAHEMALESAKARMAERQAFQSADTARDQATHAAALGAGRPKGKA